MFIQNHHSNKSSISLHCSKTPMSLSCQLILLKINDVTFTGKKKSFQKNSYTIILVFSSELITDNMLSLWKVVMLFQNNLLDIDKYQQRGFGWLIFANHHHIYIHLIDIAESNLEKILQLTISSQRRIYIIDFIKFMWLSSFFCYAFLY